MTIRTTRRARRMTIRTTRRARRMTIRTTRRARRMTIRTTRRARRMTIRTTRRARRMTIRTTRRARRTTVRTIVVDGMYTCQLCLCICSIAIGCPISWYINSKNSLMICAAINMRLFMAAKSLGGMNNNIPLN